MKNYSINNIRNIGLVGHGHSGKTTLAETIIYNGGATTRLGRVLAGNTIFDFDEDEIERQITISSAIGSCEWKNTKLNIIDTPGYANFIGDTQGCMRVMDGVVLLINSEEGIQVQTEKIWGWADDYGLARLVFVSKLDGERSDFYQVFADIKKSLKSSPVKLTLPIDEGHGFKGVIDLINMKAVVYTGEDGKNFNIEDIPDNLIAKANEERELFIETIAETDDNLIEKFLNGKDIPSDVLNKRLKEAVIKGLLVPVLCGSALKNKGIQNLMDIIVAIMPSPAECKPILVTDTRTNKKVELSSSEELFTAHVFKTIADPYAGKLSLFRVYTGKLHSDSSFYNVSSDVKERFGHIFTLQGKKQIAVEYVSVGDFAAVPKLKATHTGDSLADEKFPVIFDPINFPNPVISFAIEPKSKGDEEKVGSSLARLVEEDPTLHISRDVQTKELLLSGMGQVHIEVTIGKMKRKFGVDVEIKTPRVPYKETIKKSTKIQGKYKKQSGGRGQYGDVWIEIEPLESGKGFEFVDKVVGGAIPKQYIPAVEKGIIEAMQKGVIAGYPVVDIKITLYDGSYHDVDSSEMAFRIAASMGFKKGFVLCKPILIEPVMTMDITVPEEYIGDIIGDLNSRRGKVIGIDPKPNYQSVKANVAMSEVLKYAPLLRSMTSGKGGFSMEFSHYEEIPAHLADKVIEQFKKEHGVEDEG